MPQLINISTKKDTSFTSEAATVLEGEKYSQSNEGTYIGNASSSSIVTKLKNLDSYKKDKTTCGIVIHHGNVSKV